MGNSSTARYSDGQAIHGTEAAWPMALRERWPNVVETILRDLGGAVEASPGPAVTAPDLKRVLQDTAARGAIDRLSRKHKMDEADVARLWAGDARSTARRLDAVTSLERKVASEAGRLGATTRATIRAQVISAVAATAAPDRPVDAWWSTEHGRAVAQRALALHDRRERKWRSIGQ